MNLNYANLEHGMQSEAMRALTGQPVLVQRTKDIDETALWDHLTSHVGEANIVTASCLKDYNGLVGGHAYTVLHVQELADEKLIQLRSPTGTERYIGPFGNTDPRWSDDLR